MEVRYFIPAMLLAILAAGGATVASTVIEIACDLCDGVGDVACETCEGIGLLPAEVEVLEHDKQYELNIHVDKVTVYSISEPILDIISPGEEFYFKLFVQGLLIEESEEFKGIYSGDVIYRPISASYLPEEPEISVEVDVWTADWPGHTHIGIVSLSWSEPDLIVEKTERLEAGDGTEVALAVAITARLAAAEVLVRNTGLGDCEARIEVKVIDEKGEIVETGIERVTVEAREQEEVAVALDATVPGVKYDVEIKASVEKLLSPCIACGADGEVTCPKCGGDGTILAIQERSTQMGIGALALASGVSAVIAVVLRKFSF